MFPIAAALAAWIMLMTQEKAPGIASPLAMALAASSLTSLFWSWPSRRPGIAEPSPIGPQPRRR